MFVPASPKIYQIKKYTTGELLSIFQIFSENFRGAFRIQPTQSAFAYSKLTKETPEQVVEYVQS